MYVQGPYRQPVSGEAPWWFATDKNRHPSQSGMVVGDRGLVIRHFRAKLGGEEFSRPSFSVLCDKLELGTPDGLSSLKEGDFVDMSIEVLVLPRAGNECVASSVLKSRLCSTP